MNKRKAEKTFKEAYREELKELSSTDKRLFWNAYTEGLYQNGEITEKQLYEWDQPQFIKK